MGAEPFERARVEVLEAEAMKLTAEERAHLADRLIASLSEDTAIEEACGLPKSSVVSLRLKLAARL